MCVQPTLFANSITPIDTSSFALSTVDNTCPVVLRFATQLGPFIRERIQSQLKQYGEPRIIQEPSSYTIDGHAAAITLASVIVPAPSGNVARTIYAAKACVLGSIPARGRKQSGGGHILLTNREVFDGRPIGTTVLNHFLTSHEGKRI